MNHIKLTPAAWALLNKDLRQPVAPPPGGYSKPELTPYAEGLLHGMEVSRRIRTWIRRKELK